MRHLILLAAVALLAGCQWLSPPGKLTVTRRDGTRVTATQSPFAVAPATLKLGPTTQPGEEPAVEMGTGEGQTHDFAAEGRSASLVTWGILLMVLAAGLLVARAWLPVIPISASLALGALGLLLLMLPTLPAWVFWAGLGVAALIFGIGWWDNHQKNTAAGLTPTGKDLVTTLQSKLAAATATTPAPPATPAPQPAPMAPGAKS